MTRTDEHRRRDRERQQRYREARRLGLPIKPRRRELTTKEVIAIRSAYSEGQTPTEIAEAFGLASISHVCAIVSGERFPDLPGAVGPRPIGRPRITP